MQPDSVQGGVQRGALQGLIVLTLLNLLNYIDRQVLPAVVVSVQRSLDLSDAEAGMLGTGFVLVFIVMSPIFGILGDTRPRKKLIALGAFLWSVATMASGVARGFWHLLAARVCVGVGEAAYGTIAPSLLSDYYPANIRGRIFSYFYVALPLGAALGYWLGGLLNHHYDWRMAFYFTGAPGLILAAVALYIHEPERGAHDGAQAPGHSVTWAVYLTLMKNLPYAMTVAGYAAGTFAIGALGFWMPKFLYTVRGLPENEAPMIFGGILVVAGVIGSLLGGWVADYGLRYSKQSYLWMSGLSTLMAVPFCMVALTSANREVYLTAIFIAEILLFGSTGPINAMLVNLVPPSMRASALAAATVSIHLFGDAPSPVIVGWLADHYTLAKAVLLVPAFVALSGLVWTATAWRLERR